MFTGIVTSLGRIVELQPHRLVLDAPGVDEPLGASLAVDGCCLTVAATEAAPHEETRRLAFDLLPHTLDRTRLGTLAAGDRVNLEPALRMGDSLGGHMVQGHVDEVGTVRSSDREPAGYWLDLVVDAPDDIVGFCVERGSITVNGVSLTITALVPGGFTVQLIPETQQRTNLGSLAPGDGVNLEIDVIARYVHRLLPANR